MKAKLTLWIRGVYFIHEDIELPPWTPAMDFQGNVSSRERWVHYKSEELRIMYLRQILKFNNQYEITLDIASDTANRPYSTGTIEPFIILTSEHEHE